MNAVPELCPEGKAPALDNPRAHFVIAAELGDALADLEAVAADVLRPARRRRLTRRETRQRVQRARSSLAWLRTTLAPARPAAPANNASVGDAPLFEGWCE